jgi:hypothetical protein
VSSLHKGFIFFKGFGEGLWFLFWIEDLSKRTDTVQKKASQVIGWLSFQRIWRRKALVGCSSLLYTQVKTDRLVKNRKKVGKRKNPSFWRDQSAQAMLAALVFLVQPDAFSFFVFKGTGL